MRNISNILLFILNIAAFTKAFDNFMGEKRRFYETFFDIIFRGDKDI